jgi:predicted ATP-binding protein involved in virulence
MYFLSLEVENARCFGQKQKLDLSDGKGGWKPWTVLLGENGVGKTTLLQVLTDCNLVENIFNEKGELLFKYLPPGLFSSYIRDFNGIQINFEYCTIQTGNTFQAKKIKIEANGIFDKCSDISNDDEFGLALFAYGANRRMKSNEMAPRPPHLESEFPNIVTLFSEEEFLGNAEEWLLRLHLAQAFSTGKLRKENHKLLSEVIKILINVLPDISSIEVLKPTEAGEQPRVFFETPYGRVFISQLGIGHRTMIAWIVDLAQRMFERYPNSPDPIAEPAVVLVDEIDLHLHPTWQRKLIGFLSERFKQTQFIVTAHSPLMVQAALDYDANVAVLRREGDHVVIENDVADRLRGLRVDQILTTVFGLMSARSPKLDALLEERERILSKPRLTKADSARLKELREEIGEMPTGERPEDIEAMDIIRRAAAALEEGAKNGVDKNKPTKPATPKTSNGRRRRSATASK